MARSAFGSAILVVAGALLLSGCSETLPLANLPNITRLPEKLLSKEDQQKAMNQMTEKGQTQQVEAARQIEKSK